MSFRSLEFRSPSLSLYLSFVRLYLARARADIAAAVIVVVIVAAYKFFVGALARSSRCTDPNIADRVLRYLLYKGL